VFGDDLGEAVKDDDRDEAGGAAAVVTGEAKAGGLGVFAARRPGQRRVGLREAVYPRPWPVSGWFAKSGRAR
jgi:hypothetical protein